MVRQSLINRRQALKLTQKQVAEKVGVERSSYAAYERGLRCPNLETAQRICKALKMPIYEAFPIEENKK